MKNKIISISIVLVTFVALTILTSCNKSDLPTVITSETENITTSSVKITGKVTDDGGNAVSVRGFVWHTSENPSLDDNLGIAESGVGIGEFTANVYGLDENSSYYIRAYATNSEGTAYGEQRSFTTLEYIDGPDPVITVPIVVSLDASAVTDTSAVCGGNVTDQGVSIVTVRGIVWGTTEYINLANNAGSVENGDGTGTFTSNITGLGSNTIYYFRAYATNSTGTGYGSVISFTTLGTAAGEYTIGDIGPAGGYIFYENSDYLTDGWRYLELSPLSTEVNGYVWGGKETPVGTSTDLGAGQNNTTKIVELFGDTEPFEGLETYAARYCDALIVSNEDTDYDDWFLPSSDEQWEIWWNLVSDQSNANNGNGERLDNAHFYIGTSQYWSSCEVEANTIYARAFGFSNGNYNNQPTKDSERIVRAIRRF
ncbi:MAG: hypothetical protein PHW82_10610 [Bacteroidales bacterium]|nr:hypothetical protein [Bacteroidales bacterium]